MTDVLALASLMLVSVGTLFFVAGALGLVRFPDVYSRLHALTKADNLGLGLITLGIMLQLPSPAQWLKLGLIWILVMLSGAVSCHLVARRARHCDVRHSDARHGKGLANTRSDAHDAGT